MASPSNKKCFRLLVTAECDLTVAQVWPDGDAPENPTADDVREKIESTCGWNNVVRDWDIPQDCDVWELDAKPAPNMEDDDVPY